MISWEFSILIGGIALVALIFILFIGVFNLFYKFHKEKEKYYVYEKRRSLISVLLRRYRKSGKE